MNKVLMESEEPVYLRQEIQHRQAEVCVVCSKDRSGLEIQFGHHNIQEIEE